MYATRYAYARRRMPCRRRSTKPAGHARAESFRSEMAFPRISADNAMPDDDAAK